MMLQSPMTEADACTDNAPAKGAAPHPDSLAAENVSLRLLLAQAEINTQGLLAKAGIEAREREASDKLQKLILEELHHRIKNTLATVSAIVSQSLRELPDARLAQHAIAGRLLALGRTQVLRRRPGGAARTSARLSVALLRLSPIRISRSSRFRVPISV